ncbi:hypothetical protein Y1Q_0016126 [Alligator mississippiensis]|uniref:Uncharacterized protein n=1 Tax=Alligator mississippiensis TaxID=8496 RepID=A0A151M5D7_ALLMI|nr:hypothetical protein Y1Q_0016126 [Alligator mississippiensis]
MHIFISRGDVLGCYSSAGTSGPFLSRQLLAALIHGFAPVSSVAQRCPDTRTSRDPLGSTPLGSTELAIREGKSTFP